MSFVNEFQLPQIPLKDIKTATKNFGAECCIGQGGFGKVYRGELVITKVPTEVAIKRLNTELGQGAPEFWREVMLLCRYKHENLVSLLGLCVEGGENILVYEYISKKSLDWYITRPDILSWNQRIHICIGAAHGLQYLHDPNENHERVIHRDIKSANILLDNNWKAKIADFGLSKLGPANLQLTFLFSTAAGTMGYCDPSYYETGCLTKESDIYSFGVVLFEVLCGRPAQKNYDDIRRFLSNLAPKCYEEKKIDTIINSTIKKQISPKCLQVFSNVAYRCLRKQREERPSMAEIVKELGTALRYQEEYESEKGKDGAQLESYSDEYWESKLPGDLGLIIKTLKIPRSICTIKKELFLYLRKGNKFDGGEKFFSINDDGTKCLLISSKRFLTSKEDKCLAWDFQHDSRFSNMVAQLSHWKSHDVKFQIKTSMLSLGSMYTASLVFKFCNQHNLNLESLELTTTKWETEQLSISSTHTAQKTTGDWYKIKMWNFINNGMNADFDIVLEELMYTEHPDISEQVLMIQGIDFEPIEMHEEIERFRSFWISKDDEYLGTKLPTGYQDCIAMADNHLDDTHQRELYLRFCEGFLGNNGRLWFSVCKSTGGICSMLPAKDILCEDPNYEHLETLCLAESRFSEVKKLHDTSSFCFKCKLESPMFSPEYTYACYLVFKLEDNILNAKTRLFKVVCKMDEISQGTVCAHFNSSSMNIPTIEPKSEYGLEDSSNKPRSEALRKPKYHMEHLVDSKMEERKDGWMEVMLCKPIPRLQDRKSLEVILSKFKGGSFSGIIVQGIEFRPV